MKDKHELELLDWGKTGCSVYRNMLVYYNGIYYNVMGRFAKSPLEVDEIIDNFSVPTEIKYKPEK